LRRQIRGFTMLELMIVVTIIGVLSAIAIYAYQLYTTRAKITEGFVFASGAKSSVAEYYSSYNEFPADNASAGLDPAGQITTRYVRSLEILEDGVIQVTFSEPTIEGHTLSLVPSAGASAISWECRSSLPKRFLPASCRASATTPDGAVPEDAAPEAPEAEEAAPPAEPPPVSTPPVSTPPVTTPPVTTPPVSTPPVATPPGRGPPATPPGVGPGGGGPPGQNR
jgi:type IV pilus assembly protein PilA